MTIYDVDKSISRLSTKSSGVDGISSQVLQIASPFIVESLTHIYNLSITHNIFPSDLKTAKVIPIPKIKNATSPSDHRPISVLSVLSKPLERHIHTHLFRFLETNKLLIPLQSGFRPKHSCHTALSHIIEQWHSAIQNSELTGAVFLDLKKAFDMVNHEILLKKLTAYGLTDSTTNFFKSYLANRTQKVYTNGNTSNAGTVKHGVPQGSILGPLLFCLFINDMPLSISNPEAKCELFADDSTVHVRKSNVCDINRILQQSINEIKSWCDENQMLISSAKTKSMLVTTRQKHQREPLNLHLCLGQDVIEQVSKHRLLGVIVDDKLRWEPHIDKLCKTLATNVFLLSQLKRFIRTEYCKMFFNAHIKSHYEYVSTLWDQCSANHFEKLNSLFNRAVKILSPGSMNLDGRLKALNMLPLRKQLDVNKCVFIHKILNGKCPKYMSQMILPCIQQHDHDTRNSSLRAPRPRIDLNKQSLVFSGVSLYIDIPTHIRNSRTTKTFKNAVTKYFDKDNLYIS